MANNNTIGSASVQIDAKMTQSQVEKEVSRITRILEKEKKKMDKALDLGVHINANSAKAAVTMYDTMIKKVNEYIRLKSIAEKSFMVQKSLSSSLVTSKTGYTDLDKRIAENAKFRKGTSAPAIEDEKIIKAIRKESAAEALADERRLKQAVADRLSLSIQGAKQTKLLPDNVYKDAKAKVDALKTALLDLTAQRSMKLDAKQVLTLDSQIKATQLALNNLVSSPKSMSNTKLLGTMPKQLDQFKVVIQELEKRMGALNLKTNTGTASFQRMQARVVELTAAQRQLSGATTASASASKVQQAQFLNTSRAAMHQTKAFAGLISMAKMYFGLFAMVRVVSNIQKITGEFEMQRIALGAIIKDQHKANQLFEEAQRMAVKSPFQVKDIITQMKQLSAYQIDKNVIAETTSRLGDLSAGLGVPMERLILAYGQVSSASVLRGQELRQFTEAGIPMVQRLAEKFTLLNGEMTSTADVFTLISERKVPFEMVKAVLFEMTEEGGNFNKMQEKMSETLKGSMSNLIDEIQIAYNKIGESNMGLMKGTVDSAKGMAKFISNNIDMINVMAMGFVSAKLAVIAYNSLIGTGNVALVKRVALENKQLANAARFRLLTMGQYGAATRVSAKAPVLNSMQTLNLIKGDGGLDKNDATRLLHMNKLNAASKRLLETRGLLTMRQLAMNKAMQKIPFNATIAGMTKTKIALHNLNVAGYRAGVAIAGFSLKLAAGMKAMAVSLATSPMVWMMAIFAGVSAIYTAMTAKSKALKASAEAINSSIVDSMARMNDQYAKLSKDAKNSIESADKVSEKVKGTSFDLLPEKEQKTLKDGMAVLKLIVKDSEDLQLLVDNRLKGVTDEIVRYRELKLAVEDYKRALEGVKADPTEVSGMIQDSGLVKTVENFQEKSAKIIKNLKTLNDGRANKFLLQAITEASANLTNPEGFDKAMVKLQYRIRKEYEQTLKNAKTPKETQSARLDYMTVSTVQRLRKESWSIYQAIDKDNTDFTNKLNKRIESGGKEAVNRLAVNIMQTARDAEPEIQNAMTFVKSTALKGIGIDEKAIEEASMNPLITTINNTAKELNKSMRGLEEVMVVLPNTQTELGWGISDIAKHYRDDYEAFMEDYNYTLQQIQSMPAGFLRDQFIKALEGKEPLKAEYEFIGNNVFDFRKILKPKTTGAKGKTAFEKAYDRISTQKEVVDKMKALYEELAQSMSKIEAQQQVLDLFADSGLFGEGKLVSFKDIPSLSDGDVQIYLKKAIKQLEAIPKKLEADLKKINDYKIAVIKFDTEKLKEDTDKYIKAAQKELTKVRDRMDIFKNILDKSGDYGQAQTIAFSIEGKGGMDVGEMLVQQIKEVLIKEAKYTDEELKGIVSPQAMIDLAQVEMSEDSKKHLDAMIKEYKDHNKNLILDAITSADKLQSIEQRKQALTAQSAEKLRQLRNLPDSAAKDRSIDDSTQAYKKALAVLELEQLKESEVYIQSFGDLQAASQTTLVKLKGALLKLQSEQGKYLSPTELKALAKQVKDIDELITNKKYSLKDLFIVPRAEIAENEALIDKLEEKKRKLEEEIAANRAIILQGGQEGGISGEGAWKDLKFPIGREKATQESIEQGKELEEVIVQIDEAYQSLADTTGRGKVVSDKFIDQNKIAADYISDVGSALSETTTLVNGLSKAMGASENEEFNKVMESLSDALAMAQTGMALFALVTKTTKDAETGATTTTWALNTAMYANPAFWLAAGLLAVVGALKLFIYFSDKAANTEIDNMEERIKASKKALASLENSIKDTAGNDYISNISQQIQELEDQAVSTQRQLEAERSKTKQDDDKIEEYENSVTSAQQAVIDKHRELISELAGGDLKSVTENMVKVFVDAHRAGADTFDAIKKSFGEMIDSMIVKTIAAQVIQTHLKGVLDMIETMVVGGITEGELAELSMGVLEASRNINSSMQAITPLLNATDNLFGGGIGGGSLGSGIAGASEETVSILAGYWLAHLDVTTFMRNDVAQILSIMQANNLPNAVSIGEDGLPNSTQLSDYSQMYLQNLVQIEANTALGARKTSEMLDMFNSMKVINDDGGSLFALKVR